MNHVNQATSNGPLEATTRATRDVAWYATRASAPSTPALDINRFTWDDTADAIRAANRSAVREFTFEL